MRLTPGTFLGSPVATRSLNGLILTEYRYPAETNLRRHSHELAYFSVVLAGSYDEAYSFRQTQACTLETVLFHPADETHRDRFGNRGGQLFSLELAPEHIARAKEYELRVEEPIRLP